MNSQLSYISISSTRNPGGVLLVYDAALLVSLNIPSSTFCRSHIAGKRGSVYFTPSVKQIIFEVLHHILLQKNLCMSVCPFLGIAMAVVRKVALSSRMHNLAYLSVFLKMVPAPSST